MKIQFKKITIHNIMSFTDATVNLNVPGYILVAGENNNKEDNSKSNGSGKSSLFESILWVLTGETSRGISGKDMLKRGEKEGYATLWFSVNSDEYEITRGITSSQNLTIIKNGEDVSGKGIKASQEILKDLFPELTMSLLSNIVVLGQGLPNKFTSNTPSGRKESLEKLFKADFMIEDIKTRINDRLSALKDEQRVIEDNILSNRSKLDVIRNSLSFTTSTLESLQSPEELKSELTSLQTELSKLTSEKTNIETGNKTVNEHNEKINEQLKALSFKRMEVSNDTYLVKEIEEITEKGVSLKNDVILLDKEITSKDSITDTCPTCGQKLIGVEKPDTTEDKKRSMKMKEELDTLRAQVKELQIKRKEHLDKQLQDIDNEYNSLSSTLKRSIDTSDIENKITNTNSQINSITNELNVFNNKKTELENTIKIQEQDIKDLEKLVDDKLTEKIKLDSRLEVVNKINSTIKRDFRGYLLSNIIAVLNTTCKDYAKEVFGHDSLTIEQDGNNIAITINNKEYNMLSGGEKKKVDIIIQLALRTVLSKYTGITSNIMALDEIFDELDEQGVNQVLNLLTNKLNIPTIYIISHHADSLSIPYDGRIIVKKNNVGSTAIQI